MKKNITLTLILLFMLTGCLADSNDMPSPLPNESAATAAPRTEIAAAPLFKKDELHEKSEEFPRYFTIYTAQDDDLTISIERTVYSDEAGIQIWKTVTNSMKSIKDVVPVEPLTLYVVDRLADGYIKLSDNIIYCTMDDLDSGAYRETLVKWAFDTREPWQTIGITHYIFDGTSENTVLHEYYEQADEEGMDVLSLFPAYFISTFASGDELSIAHKTAHSIIEYVIGRYGIETLDNNYRQEWLDFIGVGRVYHDSYAESLEGFTYSSSAEYPLIAVNQRNDKIYISPMMDVKTPLEVRMFLLETVTGVKAMLDGAVKNAPDYYQTVLDYYDEPISYYCGMPNSRAYTFKRKVNLLIGMAFYHETMHIIVPPRGDPSLNWRTEGIAEYFQYNFFQHRMDKESYYNIMMAAYENGFNDEYTENLIKKVNTIYLQHADMPENPEEMDVFLYIKALAEVDTMYLKQNINHTSLADRVEGTDLSYHQAFHFTDFLINKTSLSTFLEYCYNDISFEEAFLMTYDEARAGWEENIGRKYSLLNLE